MIKLLVVDDESTTRKGLIKHIPWNKLGVNLIEEAKDGIEALEIADRINPDIVLSDIRMPGMNGIELAFKLREQQPNCKIIFLSGYSDKEYLKAAINLSAVSYVEKPINLSEVMGAVQKAVELCVEEEKRRISEMSISTVLTENIPFVKQKIIMNLIERKADVEEALNELRLINVPIKAKGRYNALIIKLQVDGEIVNKDSDINYTELIQVLDECIKEEAHISAYRDNKNIVVFLSAEEPDYQYKLTRAFEHMVKAAGEQKFKGTSLFCSVGQNVNGIENIAQSYQTALSAMNKIFFYGYNNIIFYNNNGEDSYFIDENIHVQFTEYLSELRAEEAILLIEKLCLEIKKHDTTPVNHVKNIFFKLAFQLFMEAEKRGIYFSETGDNEEKYLWNLISDFQTLQEVKGYMVNKITSVFKRIEELESSSRTVYEVKKYIKSNFSDENLSIKLLADKVYLTPAYLSGLFKKETGKTISEYIVDVRIEKSKDYLKDNRLKLFEVARNVGYSEANYYAKVFKKLVGLTPSEYREKFLS